MTAGSDRDLESPSESDQDQTTASNLRRHVVRGGSFFFAVRTIAQVMQWSVTLIVASLLVPADYGIMTSATLLIGFADLMSEAGIGRALVQRQQCSPRDLAQTFTLSLVLAIVFYMLVFAIAGPIAQHLRRPEFAWFARTIGLVVFCTPFRSVAGAVLETNLHLKQQSTIHLIFSATQSLVVLNLAWWGLGYWALGLGSVCARVLEVVLVIHISRWRPTCAWLDRSAWGFVRFGLTINLGVLLWFLYSNADFAVVGWSLGDQALGVYSLAFQLISLPVQRISANVNQVMYAVFCRLQDEPQLIRNWFLRLARLMAAVSTPALVGLALVADDALSILGPQWGAAVVPFRLLCPVGIIMVVSSALPQLLVALNRPDINLKYTATCALLFPIGFLLASQHDGIKGVCVVWLTLYPVLVIGLFHVTRHITSISVGDIIRSLRPVVPCTLVMMAVVWSTRTLCPADAPMLRLCLAVIVGVVSYSACIGLLARNTIISDLILIRRDIRG